MPKCLLNQQLEGAAIFHAPVSSVWQLERHGVAVCGVGAADLLRLPLTAFFASRRCPGTAIRAATAWALAQARAKRGVIGGFHSPLEQSVLRLLIEAGGPAVMVLARPVATATLRADWSRAVAAGHLAIVSHTERTTRLTEDAADSRNDLAARLADDIAVAHADHAGRLERQCTRWIASGLAVRNIANSGASAS